MSDEERARQARSAAAKKAASTRRRKRDDKRQQARANESKALAPARAEVRRAPRDPYARLKLAETATQAGALSPALRAYSSAFAIGIPSLRDSGLSKWKYAQVLWQTKAIRDLPDRLERIADAEKFGKLNRTSIIRLAKQQADDVFHVVQEAEAELRKHLRSDPDDAESLKAMIGITRLLRRSPGQYQEALRRSRARPSRVVKGANASRDRSGISFETRCLSLLQGMGLRTETTSISGDGGIDIVAWEERPLIRSKFVIQCKDWEAPVGEPVLRDLLGVMHSEDAAKAVLITSSAFTGAARRFADGKRLELVDGDDLRRLETNAE